MDKIAHHSGVAFPSARRDGRVAISIQITHPVSSWGAFCHADQFSPMIANNDPCLVLEIDYFVEVLSVLFKASMLKSHILKKTSVNARLRPVVLDSRRLRLASRHRHQRSSGEYRAQKLGVVSDPLQVALQGKSQ